jgi:protein phosphatase
MIYVSTHAGKRHCISEDAVIVGTEVLTETSKELPMPESGFVCVADGVGGNHGGDQASQFVLTELANWNCDAHDNLKDFLVKTNERLIARAIKDGVAINMATTLTGICIIDGTYQLVHIGNTRAYVKQGKYLKQITSDHTTYNWLLSSGQVEAAAKYNRSEITNCFGGNDPVLLSKLFIRECQQFSLVLLTSDGVHDYVDLDSLEAIISGEGTLGDKCEEIIQRAKDAGSADDLSVVIICPSEE